MSRFWNKDLSELGGITREDLPDEISLDTLKQIQSLTAENAELKQRVEWVSVEDRLPEPDTAVLAWLYNPYQKELGPWSAIGSHNGAYWTIGHTNVTHWMPLPSPPKQGDSN